MTPLELQEKFLWAWKKFYSIRNPMYYAISRYILGSWARSNKTAMKELKAFSKK